MFTWYTTAAQKSSFAVTTPTPGQCGNPTVLSGNFGRFTSPGYPGDYPNNVYCSWQISVSTDYVVAIRFSAFSLQNETYCGYDHLIVYDGSSPFAPHLARLCGSSARTIFTTDQNAFVVFRTDGSVTESGFSANFTAKRRFHTFEGACDFDEDQCNSRTTASRSFRWYRLFGRTSSSSTGPSSDHTSGYGYYMYTEASSGITGSTASLTFPIIRSAGLHCLQWFYHMYGATMGTLNVYVSQPQYPDVLVWTRSGNQGNQWLSASTSILINASVFQVSEKS
ncbi:enteropeptidase-like [Branchiostoma floridae x Branchiostoma belcheri]